MRGKYVPAPRSKTTDAGGGGVAAGGEIAVEGGGAEVAGEAPSAYAGEARRERSAKRLTPLP
jgi:hypothetical protein